MLTSPLSLSFLVTGSVQHNSRALRQLRALVHEGFECEVWDVDSRDRSHAVGFKLHSLTPAHTRGAAFFWDVHRTFSRALRHSETTRRHGIIHASDLYTLPAACFSARRTGATLTFDSRELYPHVAATVGRPWVSSFWRLVESRFLPRCDAIFTVNDSIADHISRNYEVPRPVVVVNVPPLRTATPTNLIRSRLGLNDRVPIVLHQGQIRRDRGCTVLVRAAARVSDAHIVFLGNGPLRSQVQQIAADLRITDRVHLLDPVPPDQLLDLTSSATIGTTLLEDTCLNHHFALPNKLFEYLMAGVPVLASNLPEIRKVVSEFNVGQLATPGNVDDTAGKLHYMVSDPARLEKWRANTSDVFETINWESASERFVNVFRRLAQSRQ